MAGFATMGRKRRVDAEGNPIPPKPTAIAVRGSLEWREWLERGARHCRLDVAKLVDLSVTKYLRDQGFAEPPPER